jgi:hypothetical protein
MKKINQDQQIKTSDVYDDTVSSGATMESAATNLEDDLNAIRSQLKGIAGSTNWYDAYPGATDSTAIHDNVSGEISVLTLKATLVGADVILVEDSAAANAKKSTTISGIPHNSLSGYEVNRHIDWTAVSAGTIDSSNYSQFDSNAIHKSYAGEISTITLKSVATGTDLLIIEDSIASNSKKRLPINGIPHNSLSGYEANRHIDWTAASAGTIHATNYTVGAATDTDAIHKSTANEIAVLTLKTTLVGADVILVEDSAAGNAKKRTTVSGIPHDSLSGYSANRHIDWTAASAGTIDATNYSSVDSTAIHKTTAGELSVMTAKATPVSADILLIEDSAAANAKKRITISAIPHDSLSGYVLEEHLDWSVSQGGDWIVNSDNYPDAIRKSVSGEIAVLTLKATLVGADVILVEDSAAANAKKRTTVAGIPHNSLSGYEANRHIDWTAASAGTINTTNYTRNTLQQAWDSNGTNVVSVGAGSILWQVTDSNEFNVTTSDGVRKLLSVVPDATSLDTVSVDADWMYVTTTNAVDFSKGIKAGTALGNTVSLVSGQISFATSGLIFSNGAGSNLELEAGNNLILSSIAGGITLNDSRKTGSTYAGTFEIAASSAEYSAFDTNFGEVSLLNAINQNSAKGWTSVKLASDHSNSNTTETNVTGWTFTPAANKTYEYEVMSLCTTADLTTGIRMGTAGGMGGTITHGAKIDTPILNTTTAQPFHIIGTAAQGSLATSAPSLSPQLITIKGMIISGATPSGALQVTLKSEISTSAVTIKAGSIFRWREIV